ncbi:NAD(P)H-binding protein [Streptantibioticus cattleyicolor]|uniref:NmrA family protein n=1 Tax=Streptantibioticus cattleyicolor (strain ATCC 35852 / DSM 46488 / JCM 4925 / NBRC 14057 / NRRL 8057) TaxID=1003195 RepID=F8JKB9_STREN|nr:NAD(P)H-binding protein [Streptantibioticus cattleyicolor]AEW98516.1 NmrA family protein [Streptantibioticus cattleyicolor NRRL 8057 = DSM 46488]CCB72425.1 NmrA family protein [Streptantibioticus cattleyicolor NRRL 8057 = DSM 46488]
MIVITAPTGNIGRQVLTRLLAAGESVRVIARDPARLDAAVRDRAEVVQGSHGDARVVSRAFDGADAVFWLLPADRRAAGAEEAYVGFTRPAAEAMRATGVKRVVGVSTLGRGTPYAGRAGHVTASLAMDDLIASTGVAFRALCLPGFMENMLRQAGAIREQGAFFDVTAPDLPSPVVATRDIADVAARLLLDTSWSGQEEVPVLGPEDLSNDDMAAVVSEVLGTPVRYRRIPGQALRDRLTGAGFSDAMAQAMLDMMAAKDDGYDRGATRTLPNAVTGPTTFRQWCEDTLKPAVAAI